MLILANIIDEATGMSIGLILAIVGPIVLTIVAAAWAISNRLTVFENRVKGLESNHYSMSQAVEVALRTAIENPGMKVPDPRNPLKFILVSAASVHTCGETG